MFSDLFTNPKKKAREQIAEAKHNRNQHDAILTHGCNFCSILNRSDIEDMAIFDEFQKIRQSMLDYDIKEIECLGYNFTIDKWDYLNIEPAEEA